MSKLRSVLLFVSSFVLLSLIEGSFLASSTSAQLNNTLSCPGVMCAADAQQCPDGSYVGRTGCDCQFAACPQATASPSPSLTPSPSPSPMGCVRAGCSGQLCVTEAQAALLGNTTCLFKPEYACYQQADCRMQANNQCGFTQSNSLVACLDEADPQDHPVHWETEHASLKADDFYIVANGKRFTGANATFTVSSDPAIAYDYTTLEVTWFEKGIEMRLFMYFHKNNDEWWSNEFRVFNGASVPQWVYFLNGQSGNSPKDESSFFITPLGNSFVTGNYSKMATGPDGTAHIYFKNVTLKAFRQSQAILSGDLNNDGSINLLDYSLFIQGYKSSLFNPTIDFNGDERLNLLDYAIFIQYYTS